MLTGMKNSIISNDKTFFSLRHLCQVTVFIFNAISLFFKIVLKMLQVQSENSYENESKNDIGSKSFLN